MQESGRNINKKRVFIAVDISDTARNAISEYLRKLKFNYPKAGIKWERADKLHLTIKFIGEVEEKRLSEISAVAERAASAIKKFNVALSSTGVFPKPSQPRILWVGTNDASASLFKVKKLIEIGCEMIGIERDDKILKPHLTVGRVKDQKASAALTEIHLNAKIEPVEFEIASVRVYESKLLPRGSIYSVISTHDLR